MLRLCIGAVLFLLMLLTNTAQAEPSSRNEMLIYFGTYTNGASKGIYFCRFDSNSGALSPISSQVIEGLQNPSFLAIHPNHKYLYAVSEVDDGSIWSFKINEENGQLTLLNHQSTAGKGPCFVSIDQTGRVALVANYNDGSISSLPINNDGSLSAPVSVTKHSGSSFDAKRQAGPHAHSINVSPDNRFAIACDLGADKLMVYKLNAEKAKLSPSSSFQVRPGAGPRHLVFSKDERFVYVANELSNNISVFAYDMQKGTLEEVQLISTIRNPEASNTVAEIQIHPSGGFLYCSNRGEDSLAVYSIDRASGKLSPAAYHKTKGETPRNFSIDPHGNFLLVCNQGSNNVVVFKIDQSSGRLLQIEEPLNLPEPVCVKFVEQSQASQSPP